MRGIGNNFGEGTMSEQEGLWGMGEGRVGGRERGGERRVRGEGEGGRGREEQRVTWRGGGWGWGQEEQSRVC